jgi:hypothetical protein
MRCEDDSISAVGLIKASLQAKSLTLTNAIATRDFTKRKDGSGLIDVTLLLYKCEDDAHRQDDPEPIDCKVSVPIGWTPRILLSLLNKSVRSHGVISLETLSINELNCYSGWKLDDIESMLLDEGAYAGVVGGVFIY